MKLRERAEKEAIRASVEDFPSIESPVVFEVYKKAYESAFKEAIALAAEWNAFHIGEEAAKHVRALAEPETPPGACL